jgi:hypothetical protein
VFLLLLSLSLSLLLLLLLLPPLPLPLLLFHCDRVQVLIMMQTSSRPALPTSSAWPAATASC